MFRNFVTQNFPFLENDFDALTDYELFCKMMDYVLKLSADNVEFRQELDNYKHYFENLDVQEEINKKLDEMAEDGTLTLLIKQYVDPIYQQYQNTINNEIQLQNAKLIEQDSIIANQNNAITEIDDKVKSAVSGTPKGVYATLSALESADPDHNYIYVVSANGNWYYYDTTESAWTSGGTYQSSGIGTGAIDLAELESNVKYSINSEILSPTWIDGKYIQSNGTIGTNASYEYCKISLKKGDKIVFSTINVSGNITLGSYERYREGDVFYSIVTGTGTSQTISHTAQYDGIYGISGRTADMSVIKKYSKNETYNFNEDNKTNFIDNIIKNDNVDVTEGKIVNANNGTIQDYTTYANEFYATNYIEIKPSTSITLEIKGKQLAETVEQFWGLAFYNENKTFISGAKYGLTNKLVTTTPVNAKYIVLTITSNMYQAGYSLYYTNLTNFLNNYMQNVESNYYDLWRSLKVVGAIGDSLASGAYSYIDNNEVHYENDFTISWAQYMARTSGNKYINFSWGGMTTRGWLTSQYGLPKANNPENLCDAYIIGLGVNDANNLGSGYLGTSADIDVSDYTNNADTFYGNYAGIIQRMKEIQPKAVFFLFTMPRTTSSYTGFNTAVRTIAGMFDNCYLIDLENDYLSYFASGSFVDNNKRNGHYNSIAYNVIAQYFEKWISKVMFDNYEDFEFLEYIGTDHEYSE